MSDKNLSKRYTWEIVFKGTYNEVHNVIDEILDTFGNDTNASCFQLGEEQGEKEFLFMPNSQELVIDDYVFQLSRVQYYVLYTLYKHRGNIVNREMLKHPISINKDNRTIDQAIHRLSYYDRDETHRNEVFRDFMKTYIETVHGRGYRWKAEKHVL